MKIKSILLIVVLPCIGYLLNAQGINGTNHDFRNSGMDWNIPENTCTACHVSDNEGTIKFTPLWINKGKILQYTPYLSTSENTDSENTNNDSKLCLSCHDGTIAVDNLGIVSHKDNTLNTIVTGEHPVSVNYQNSIGMNSAGLYNHYNKPSGLGNSINQDLLYNEKLECASCHDVHNLNSSKHLLRIKNTKSELCLTCHNK